jgi:hypothetical protein
MTKGRKEGKDSEETEGMPRSALSGLTAVKSA